jgi:hypothetical protein
MQASIRRYRTSPDRVAEVMHRVDEVLAGRLEEMPGFVAYECIDCGDGQVCSMTICSDRAAVERGLELARDFVRDELSDIEVEALEFQEGEVAVSRARNEVLEPAHA